MKKEYLPFIKDNSLAIVSTHDGFIPHGKPIYYHFDEDENAFYFMTINTTKTQVNLRDTLVASLTIFVENPPTVLTVDCDVEFMDYKSPHCTKVVDILAEIHATRECYPTPLATRKEASLSLVKLKALDYEFRSYLEDIERCRP